MSKYYQDVKLFHDKFGLVTPETFTIIPQDLYEFRVVFFNEELNEYVEAHETQDLPTAIDSLIDLVYITCGAALLHGSKPEIFDPGVQHATWPFPVKPSLLDVKDHHDLKDRLRGSISLYREGYEHEEQTTIERGLSELYRSSIIGARLMGFDAARWNLLWDDVQRANMSKERAQKASDSKRGSAWDVVKPPGWQPPNTECLVEQMLKGML